jgi:hypothetical protein
LSVFSWVLVDAGLVVGTVGLIVCMQHASGVSLFKGFLSVGDGRAFFPVRYSGSQG